MYAARCKKSTGFNSERNTLPGAASPTDAPGAAENTPLIAFLHRGRNSLLRLVAPAPQGMIPMGLGPTFAACPTRPPGAPHDRSNPGSAWVATPPNVEANVEAAISRSRNKQLCPAGRVICHDSACLPMFASRRVDALGLAVLLKEAESNLCSAA